MIEINVLKRTIPIYYIHHRTKGSSSRDFEMNQDKDPPISEGNRWTCR